MTGADAAVGAAMAWWAEAPGATETDIAALRGATPLGQTPLTCAAAGRIHCATQDECVQACGACTGVGQLHSSGQRCVPPPRRTEGALEAAMFIDEDVAHGVVGGVVQWQGDPGALADEFALYWSDAVGEAPLEGTPAIAKVPARFADPVPSYAIPHGTAPPPGAARILIVATNEAGATPLAAATLTDAVRPPPPVAVRFEDPAAPTPYMRARMRHARPPVARAIAHRACARASARAARLAHRIVRRAPPHAMRTLHVVRHARRAPPAPRARMRRTSADHSRGSMSGARARAPALCLAPADASIASARCRLGPSTGWVVASDWPSIGIALVWHWTCTLLVLRLQQS